LDHSHPEVVYLLRRRHVPPAEGERGLHTFWQTRGKGSKITKKKLKIRSAQYYFDSSLLSCGICSTPGEEKRNGEPARGERKVQTETLAGDKEGRVEGYRKKGG